MSSLWNTTSTALSSLGGAITTLANNTSPIAIGSNGTSTYTIAQEKTTYHILGEYVEVKGWQDPYVTMAISTLNILKKPYYEELRKNNFKFPIEVEEYLKIAFRDDLIDEIIKPTF
jgi:hypothetical protein